MIMHSYHPPSFLIQKLAFPMLCSVSCFSYFMYPGDLSWEGLWGCILGLAGKSILLDQSCVTLCPGELWLATQVATQLLWCWGVNRSGGQILSSPLTSSDTLFKGLNRADLQYLYWWNGISGKTSDNVNTWPIMAIPFYCYRKKSFQMI